MGKTEKEIEIIAQELREKPYLLEFMKECLTSTEEQRNLVLQALQRMQSENEKELYREEIKKMIDQSNNTDCLRAVYTFAKHYTGRR